MRRKGFLAALLGLAAAPALAKVKPKPEFPRWFLPICPCTFGGPWYLYVVRSQAHVQGCYHEIVANKGGPWRREYVWPHNGFQTSELRRGVEEARRPMDLRDCLGLVREGYFREITAAEAEALLKPEDDDRLWMVQGLTNDKLRLYGPVGPGLRSVWPRWNNSTGSTRYAPVGRLVSAGEAATLAAHWGVTMEVTYPGLTERQQYPLGNECVAPDGIRSTYVKFQNTG